MVCPKCGAKGEDPKQCQKCGIYFEGYRHFQDHLAAARISPLQSVEFSLVPGLSFLDHSRSLFIVQKEDALRIFTGWQTRNHYLVVNEKNETLAYLAERDEGWIASLLRVFLRSGRPFQMDLIDPAGTPLCRLTRPFAFIFPVLTVTDAAGSVVGHVRKKFGFIRNIHELHDGLGTAFASLRSTLLGGRSFGEALFGNQAYHLIDQRGEDTGALISRQWNGLLNRVFTDQDTFLVDFGTALNSSQKLLLLAAAVCIDFEAFETQKSPSSRAGWISGLISLTSSGDPAE